VGGGVGVNGTVGVKVTVGVDVVVKVVVAEGGLFRRCDVGVFLFLFSGRGGHSMILPRAS